jgi:hypothetical protein
MEDKRRASFRFERDSEVRYVTGRPEVGDYVTHAAELWVISDVGEDDLGISVICEHTSDREPLSRRVQHPSP